MFAKSMPDYGKPSATMNFKKEKLLETTISDQQTAGLGYADNSHCGVYKAHSSKAGRLQFFLCGTSMNSQSRASTRDANCKQSSGSFSYITIVGKS